MATFETPPRFSAALLVKLSAVVLLAVACCALLITRYPDFNGMPFHHHDWRWIASWRIYPAMLAAAMPTLAAQFVPSRRWALVLLTVATLWSELAAAGMPHPSFDLWRISTIVADPFSTGYFDDALEISRKAPLGPVIRDFPVISGYLHLHSRQKPPGQIVYNWMWIRLFGANEQAAALFSGLGILLIAALVAPATYGLTRVVTGERATAFAAASFMSLLPGMIDAAPTFDQLYALGTCAIVGGWYLAIRSSDRRWIIGAAVLVGVATAVLSFCAYTILTLGTLCAAIAVLQLLRHPNRWRRLLIATSIVFGCISLFYVALYLAFRFDPIAMFHAAMAQERRVQTQMPMLRTWPLTLPWDLRDFMLAQGWLSLPLIVCGLVRSWNHPRRKWILLCVGQILLIWISGLLRAETARVWLFLQPLILIPVGLELSRWPRWARVSAFLCLAVVTACVVQNLAIVSESVLPPMTGAF